MNTRWRARIRSLRRERTAKLRKLSVSNISMAALYMVSTGYALAIHSIYYQEKVAPAVYKSFLRATNIMNRFKSKVPEDIS